MFSAAGLAWHPLEAPGFKPGLLMTVIHGDPTKEGDYTIRLRFPAGYDFPAHWHPNGEHVTVLRGEFKLGMGSKEDASLLKTYGPGDFRYIPRKMSHFGGVTGVTEVQLHGMGPFEIKLTSGREEPGRSHNSLSGRDAPDGESGGAPTADHRGPCGPHPVLPALGLDEPAPTVLEHRHEIRLVVAEARGGVGVRSPSRRLLQRVLNLREQRRSGMTTLVSDRSPGP